MSYNKALMAEISSEAAATKKILEKVPRHKNDWKPHEKSMKLGNLSTHIADLPGWIAMAMATDELDLSKMDYKPVIHADNADLVAHHDTNVQKAMSALENATDADFDKMWTLRNGDHVIFTMPKKAVIRSMACSHLYHHRGQLSVYLRLLDVHVPGMYGPSADERPAPVAAAAN